jgi:hypothetical protein
MARKIKSDTRNIARRILALDAAYEGRIVKMLEAFENAADAVKKLAAAEANERRAWQMYMSAFTGAEEDAADKRHRQEETIFDRTERLADTAQERAAASIEALLKFDITATRRLAKCD